MGLMEDGDEGGMEDAIGKALRTRKLGGWRRELSVVGLEMEQLSQLLRGFVGAAVVDDEDWPGVRFVPADGGDAGQGQVGAAVLRDDDRGGHGLLRLLVGDAEVGGEGVEDVAEMFDGIVCGDELRAFAFDQQVGFHWCGGPWIGVCEGDQVPIGHGVRGG